jgi:hypothetical protein
MNLLAANSLMPFVERLFGGGSATAGEGREATLDWSAPWATWITLALVIAAAIFVIVIYTREHTSRGVLWRYGLATLRLALIALTLFMLYRLVLRPYKTDLPDLVIVLDDSASMSFADPYEDKGLTSKIRARLASLKFDEATRENLAKTLLLENDAELLAELGRRYNVKFYLASDSLRPLAGEGEMRERILAVQADRPDSRLGRAVIDAMQAQRGRPTAAIIVLSDGITTEGRTLSDAAEIARRKMIPLFTVGLGNDKPLRDVWVADVLADEIAFVGDIVPFEFKLGSSGYAGQEVQVRLREKSSGRVVDQTNVKVGDDGASISGRLRHRPTKPGEYEYIIEIAPPEGDSNQSNNSHSVALTVRDETIRVLLVQEYPSFEFRYLKNLLSRQRKASVENAAEGSVPAKSIELNTVLQNASRDYVALDETALAVFPVKRDELFKYDVIIFGDVNPSFLSQQVMQNLAAFVEERGGGVIFNAGPKFTPLSYRGTPLAALFPVNLDVATAPDPREELTQSFIVQPTSLGLASPHMQLADTAAASIARWQKLPGIYWLLETPEVKPGARVLAEHPTHTGSDGRPLPVITMQFIGAGKVILHNTDETWRWRFRTGDALWGRYWLQTIRYLARSKLVGKARVAELASDRQTYRRGDVVNLRVRFFDEREAPAQDDGVAVVVEQAGGRNRRVTLERGARRGVFETALTGLGPGRYRAWMATPTLADGAPTTEFTVEDPGGELARLRMDVKDLQTAAQRSGGKFYTFATAGKLLRELPAGRQVPIEALDPVPIWNSNLIAGLFVVLLVTEWLLRKRAGMV